MTFADAKQRFSNRAADYVRYRPGYPSELLDVLRKECDLRPGHVIADIGSGTGFLSELFLKNGNAIFGVEPNREMREAGELHLQSYRLRQRGGLRGSHHASRSVRRFCGRRPSFPLVRAGKNAGGVSADSAAARLGRRHLELP